MLKRKSAPAIARVNELLSYDRTTGDFRWKVGRQGTGGIGSVAGTTGENGYRIIFLNGVHRYVHRLVWLLETGEWPEYLDHKDRNKLNNRFENLRPASANENGYNRKVSCNSSSGFKGVTWVAREQRWQAAIRVNGRRIYLKRHKTADEAAAAYNEAALRFHGQFAAVDD